MPGMMDYIGYANNGQFAQDPSASYNPIFKTDFGGQLPTQTVQGAPSYDLNTPVGQGMFGMTLGAGGAGADLTGTQAFMGAWNPGNDTKQDQFGKYTYDTGQLAKTARQLGIDTSKYNLGSGVSDADYYKLYNDMNEKLKNYHYVSGMSGGWNQTGDPRQAARTLYLDDGTGKLNPVTAPVGYHSKETGNWFQENQDGVMAALILGGGFLGGSALAAYGAGGAGAAGAGAAEGAAAGGAGAGAGEAAGTMAYMGPGSAGAGAAGEGLSTLGQLQAWYSGLPGWGQSALRGAAQSGITSGGNPEAMARGAVTGGISGGVSDALGGGLWGNIGGKVASGLIGNYVLGSGGAPGGASGGGGGGGTGSGGTGMMAGAGGVPMMGSGGGSMGVNGIPNTTAAAEAVEREKRARDSGYAGYKSASAPVSPGQENEYDRQKAAMELVQALRGSSAPKYYTA